MNKNIFTILLILVVPIFAFFILSKNSNDTAVIAKIQKPTMIKFTSKMCYDCQRLEGVLNEVYPNYNDKVALTEINVQNTSSSVQNMIKKYQVRLVPTSIFVTENGEIKERIEGFIEKPELENYLKEIANNG